MASIQVKDTNELIEAIKLDMKARYTFPNEGFKCPDAGDISNMAAFASRYPANERIHISGIFMQVFSKYNSEYQKSEFYLKLLETYTRMRQEEDVGRKQT